MIYIRSADEVEVMRHCGRINGRIHRCVADAIQPGVTTRELNDIAAEKMRVEGVKSSILGFQGFPADICVSVNEEAGHGVPSSRVIQQEDVVKIDISVEYEGFHTDCAVTHVVGLATAAHTELLETTRYALEQGIRQAVAGNRCSDISSAIDHSVRGREYQIIRRAFGHGIGASLHESPIIPNFGPAGLGPRLRQGMTLAIEPVVSAGSRLTLRENDWTDTTVDGSITAHFEHTILVTDGEPEVLTHTAEPALPRNQANPAVSYRTMRESDIPTLTAMTAREMDAILMSAWGRRSNPQDILKDDAQTMVLEDASNQVIGFFVYTERKTVLHLVTIVMDASHQGMGFGKDVMRRLEQTAKQKGKRFLELWVQTNNERAIRFYERLGFTCQGTPFPNSLLMRKNV